MGTKQSKLSQTVRKVSSRRFPAKLSPCLPLHILRMDRWTTPTVPRASAWFSPCHWHGRTPLLSACISPHWSWCPCVCLVLPLDLVFPSCLCSWDQACTSDLTPKLLCQLLCTLVSILLSSLYILSLFLLSSLWSWRILLPPKPLMFNVTVWSVDSFPPSTNRLKLMCLNFDRR